MKKIIIILFLTIISYSLFSNATVYGTIYNQDTLEPLANVNVLVWAESSTPGFWEVVLTTGSDDFGDYFFEIQAGEYNVQFNVSYPIFGTSSFDIILEDGQIVEQDVYIQDMGLASWDTGYVFEIDGETGEQIPLADVLVFVDDELEPSTTTDENGFFGIIGIYGEEYTWTFVKDGYETSEIEINAGYNAYTIEMIQLVGISLNDINLGSKLHNNHPNPFNPSTTIEFSIQNNALVELSIFNVKGQKIITLIDNQIQGGNHSIIWNGNNETGNHVSSGIYYYKLNVNEKNVAVKKCMLLK